ncbi:hypothetical protein QL285_027129 [Trifolium repens]|nr:hypothetical protein QL285_027129 [Trifolium repens]
MTVTIETSRSKETNAQDVERFKEAVKKLEDSSPKKDIPLSKKCNVTLSRKPWQDSKCLSIPCSIGEVDIEGALCDFNSRINFITISFAKRLGMNLELMDDIDMTLTLAVKFIYGVS